MGIARKAKSTGEGVRPRPLRPGGRIALVAPASPFDPEILGRASAFLERIGFQTIIGRHSLDRIGYLAGPDVARSEDLLDALSDPSISAIFCIRGGYGSGRLLPYLPFHSLRSNPKILVGYSDITFLHLAFWRTVRWVTFHGPNLVEWEEETSGRSLEFLASLQGERSFSWQLEAPQVLRPGLTSGILLGGNLTCLNHLLMTPFCPDFQGVLLMLEDRGEALYRLDRQITQLRLAGLFDRIAGLILGQFQDCGPVEDIWEMVLTQVRPYSFPVIAGLPFGHGSANDLLPLGISYSLNTYEGLLRAEEQPFVQ
jgi:muramoyltetrapeptide carboxypeptidase